MIYKYSISIGYNCMWLNKDRKNFNYFVHVSTDFNQYNIRCLFFFLKEKVQYNTIVLYAWM